MPAAAHARSGQTKRQPFVRTFDDTAHLLGNLLHIAYALNSLRNRFQTRRHPQQIERLVFVANGRFGVNARPFLIPTLYCLHNTDEFPIGSTHNAWQLATFPNTKRGRKQWNGGH